MIFWSEFLKQVIKFILWFISSEFFCPLRISNSRNYKYSWKLKIRNSFLVKICDDQLICCSYNSKTTNTQQILVSRIQPTLWTEFGKMNAIILSIIMSVYHIFILLFNMQSVYLGIHWYVKSRRKKVRKCSVKKVDFFSCTENFTCRP